MLFEEFNKSVDSKRAKSGGWPSDMTYTATEVGDITKVEIVDCCKDSAIWKRIDPWGFAYISEVQKLTSKPLEIVFSIRKPIDAKDCIQFEALKRRLSYLSAINFLSIKLKKGMEPENLYSLKDLENRPDAEKIRSDFKIRSDENTPGRLEKDFQAYLFGKGLHDSKIPAEEIVRTNERLALFGSDFIRIGKKKAGVTETGYKVEREFPTGAFLTNIKEENRILPTEFIDLVTINRNEELSIIELKIDDPKLEVISQILNYALFFYSYRDQLTPLINKKLGCPQENFNLKSYVVSNTFHKLFSTVFAFYANGPLKIKQVILGYMPN